MIVKSMDPVGGGRVDVATAEIEDSKASAAAAKFVGERQHVLR